MSERAQHTKKTSWRDSDPEWCCVSDDKNRIARNRRRYERSLIHAELNVDRARPAIESGEVTHS